MEILIIYFQGHPLFGLTLTLVAYGAATAVWKHLHKPALLHPVLGATALVATVLVATGMDYGIYFQQTSLLNQTLNLIVVLLAVPLYRQFLRIRQAGAPIAFALIVGSTMALGTALIMPIIAGANLELLATLAPKSATTAVSVQIAERLGGVAGLTAVVVISTGIFGAIFGPTILIRSGVTDHRAQGFALGVASHAIGTARAFEISDTAGAFAGLGMILNALLTIITVPFIIMLVGG